MQASSVSGEHTSNRSWMSASSSGSDARTAEYSSSIAGDAQHSASPAQPSFTINAAGLSGLGKVASFRTQVSRTSFKIRFGPAQGSFPAFTFDERDGFRLVHGLSGVALVRRRQRRWKPKPQ